jgi:hypothetical protein
MKQASRRESDKAMSQGRSAREKEPRVVFQPRNISPLSNATVLEVAWMNAMQAHAVHAIIAVPRGVVQ